MSTKKPQKNPAIIWPPEKRIISQARIQEINLLLEDSSGDSFPEQSSPYHSQAVSEIIIPLAAWLSDRKEKEGKSLVAGISGAQGAGKSTLCRFIKKILHIGFNLNAEILSVDDFYLTRSEREILAWKVHPLLKTRGVPGTHDVDLAMDIMDSITRLEEGETIRVPRFDKSTDDRIPQKEWPLVTGPVDILLFEGWCIGAKPQEDKTLIQPVNELEKIEDPDGRWRSYVNDNLHRLYPPLFDLLDILVFLKVPGMEKVVEWRTKQERELARSKSAIGNLIMSEEEIRRFIMHYERVTGFMLKEMPGRADVTLTINDHHEIEQIDIPE